MFLLPSIFTCGQHCRRVLLDYPDHCCHRRNGDAHTHLDWAAIAILLPSHLTRSTGALRGMTNTTSDFGKELDSLADVITFGVAPSLLA